jgi:hypothetical protein
MDVFDIVFKKLTGSTGARVVTFGLFAAAVAWLMISSFQGLE